MTSDRRLQAGHFVVMCLLVELVGLLVGGSLVGSGGFGGVAWVGSQHGSLVLRFKRLALSRFCSGSTGISQSCTSADWLEPPVGWMVCSLSKAAKDCRAEM